MSFESTEQFYEVKNSAIVGGPNPRPSAFGDESSDSLLATYGWYRLWVDNGGEKPGQYYSLQVGPVLVDEASQPPRCTRTDIWIESSPESKRLALENSIESQRWNAGRPQIDIRADPGLAGLLDEANAEASRQHLLLGNTADIDLDAFDPTFDPRAANAIQVASSLSHQERALLAAANPFTEQQRSDLAAAAAQHEAVVDAGDPNVAVPEVPSFARRMVGVMGEEYGRLTARRIFVNPWYWLEVEFELDRNIDASEYFLAVYDSSAPDDRDDTTAGYLSTAQFIATDPNKLLASKEAINLQRAFDFVYKIVICKGHLNFPQFDRITFEANLLFDDFRVRWGGLA